MITEEDSLNLTTGEWDVYLTGTKDTARLTTVVVIVTVKESGLVDAPLHELPQSVAEQLDAKVAQALLTAQAVKAQADAGKFNGKDGKGLEIKGFYEDYDTLLESVTAPNAGDAYGIGTEEPYEIYIWDAVNETWVDNGQIQGAKGDKGDPGATFTPHIDSNGNLSWTNDGNLDNPTTQNIRGATGATGATGAPGQSAYQAAQAAGYTGTEATFNTALQAMPFHNARHLPDGVDPLVCKSGNYEAGSVNNAALANGAVSTGKIADNAVSTVYTATLNTTWSGSAAPYTKAQTISGILETDKPIIDLVPSATFADAEAQEEAWANIYRAVTSANTITFYAKDKPTVSIPIQVRCIRK